MKLNSKDLFLYAVTDRKWTGKKTLFEQVEESIKGGVTFVQIREKELEYKLFLDEAIKMKDLCKKYDIPFVVNDNVDIAIKSNADGVHVGQEDMEASNVREMIGKDKILGVSVQTLEQAIEAEKKGANYLGVGAIFPTNSKDNAVKVSIETLSLICKSVNIPVVAIGGINKANINQLKNTGISGIALISAIFANDDIKYATRELKEILSK
ncbi:MAG: thiamine phosphate synthase [Fusobacteriaceae bacterium]|nr:thiamine phosphate synthase [Fusobacteriaceae bacterium]MBN2838087.1 thiamine phosphate synthase [Fusobacteriaceae bacterium]